MSSFDRRLTDRAHALTQMLEDLAALRVVTFTTSDGGARPDDVSLGHWARAVANVCHDYDVWQALRGWGETRC